MRSSKTDKSVVRPTSSMVRKAVFDILRDVENKTFVDLYAGKGTVGLEALRRGAKQVFFIEIKHNLADYIRKIAEKIDCSGSFEILNLDAVRFIETTNRYFDVVFADPPYQSGELERLFRALERKNLVSADGILIIQHHKNESLRERLKELKISKCYRYGDTFLTVYRRSN